MKFGAPFAILLVIQRESIGAGCKVETPLGGCGDWLLRSCLLIPPGMEAVHQVTRSLLALLTHIELLLTMFNVLICWPISCKASYEKVVQVDLTRLVCSVVGKTQSVVY